MDDLISRQDALNALEAFEIPAPTAQHLSAIYDCEDAIRRLPSVQPEHKWETCFECPLSLGCPKIKGCTNEQAIEYASETPTDCPLNKVSAQPEQRWIPLTERLPLPEDGQVVVQYNDGDYDILKFPTVYRRCDIVAWLPLPDPY